VTDVAYGSGRFVAVGWGGGQEHLQGRVWVSTDGSSWDLVPPDPVFARAYLTGVVTAADGRHLVFGRIEKPAGEVPHAVWESDDGHSWRRIDLGLPADLGVVQVVVGPAGYLLTGIRFSGDGDELWLSPDARHWELVNKAGPRSGPPNEQIRTIAAGAEGFVATGFRETLPYIIASADGRKWFEAPHQPALDPLGLVAALGGDWIAPGRPDEQGDVGIWFSADGLNWAQSATLPTGHAGPPHPSVSDVSSAGGQVFVSLVAAPDETGLRSAGVWSSTDGTTWKQLDLSPQMFMYAAAASDAALVLAGVTEGTEARSSFWVMALR
jgi:hypothetical protein